MRVGYGPRAGFPWISRPSALGPRLGGGSSRPRGGRPRPKSGSFRPRGGPLTREREIHPTEQEGNTVIPPTPGCAIFQEGGPRLAFGRHCILRISVLPWTR